MAAPVTGMGVITTSYPATLDQDSPKTKLRQLHGTDFSQVRAFLFGGKGFDRFGKFDAVNPADSEGKNFEKVDGWYWRVFKASRPETVEGVLIYSTINLKEIVDAINSLPNVRSLGCLQFEGEAEGKFDDGVYAKVLIKYLPVERDNEMQNVASNLNCFVGCHLNQYNHRLKMPKDNQHNFNAC